MKVRCGRPRAYAKLPKSGIIYFFRRGQDGPIKIGFTTADPRRRLRELQTGAAEKLFFFGFSRGTRKDERALHKGLAAFRQRGEWFDLPADKLEALRVLSETTRLLFGPPE